MELKQIKEMMAAMTRNGTKRFKLKRGDFEVELERECAPECQPVVLAPQPRYADIPQSLTPPPLAKREEVGGTFVTSPMVGTFYISPSPEDPAFIKVGDRVEPGTVICIIEAMKVMNEVKAGIAGTIGEVLVDNGHPVEFGTKLFRVI